MTEPTPAAAPQPAAPLTPAEDKQWASFAHFGGILWLLPSLIIYLVFKDRGTLTRQESKEALNWQITFLGLWIILQIVLGIIIAAVVAAAIAGGNYYGGGAISFLGFIPWILYILNVVFSVMGGIKVNNGGSYRYPFAIRLIK